MLAAATSISETAQKALTLRKLDHVVVLGANGTMGFGSGALFTHRVGRVTFLARSKEKADQGLAAAIAMVRSGTVAAKVDTGSYDDDFDRVVAEADLIFEAVTERLDLKQQFFERIDEVRRQDSIVATVTSGLSINLLTEGRSESFKKHFLGLHFFNPPNVIVGTELVPGDHTDPALVDYIDEYCTTQLGREMVRTKDTAGFAGNRVGFKVLNEVAQLAEEHGALLMDKVVGPYTGRALPPLATVDLVGWDIHRAIVDNIHELAPDEAHDTLKLPESMAKLMAAGTLGRKSGAGFYKKEGDTKLALDPKSGDYTPIAEIALPDLSFIEEIASLHRYGRYEEAMAAFVAADGDEAALARKVVAGYVSYAFHRVGEVTETITGIDRIMGYGFNWAPPSVLVDTIGLRPMVAMMTASDVPVPRSLEEALAAPGTPRFTHPSLTNVGRYFVAG